MFNFEILCLLLLLHLIISAFHFFLIFCSYLHIPSCHLSYLLLSHPFPLAVSHFLFCFLVLFLSHHFYHLLTPYLHHTTATHTHSHHISTILLPLSAPHCCVVLGDQIGVVSLWSSDKKIPMLDLKEVFSGEGTFRKNVICYQSFILLLI